MMVHKPLTIAYPYLDMMGCGYTMDGLMMDQLSNFLFPMKGFRVENVLVQFYEEEKPDQTSGPLTNYWSVLALEEKEDVLDYVIQRWLIRGDGNHAKRQR